MQWLILGTIIPTPLSVVVFTVITIILILQYSTCSIGINSLCEMLSSINFEKELQGGPVLDFSTADGRNSVEFGILRQTLFYFVTRLID